MAEFTTVDRYPQNNVSSLSILYVEDEEAIRSSLSRMLKRRTEFLIVAENGAEGLEQFKECKPDIVITDIRMPVMDGLTMIAHIREIDQNVPIIITTGHNDEQFFMRSIELGVDKYVKKPVDSKELLAAIVKLSHAIIQQKELHAKNKFILDLMDINPSYLAMLNADGVQYLNQSFMHFLDVKSVEDFAYRYGSLASLIVERDSTLTGDDVLGQWVYERTAGYNTDSIFQVKLPHLTEAQSFLINAVVIPATSQEYLLTITDITKFEKDKQRYQFLAEHDALTKVFNRNKINKELEREVTRVMRYKQRLSLLMIDIDFFKKVNDNYGHQIGDIVLIEIAALMQDRIRKTDVLGRFGGEEFVILMPSTPLDNAAEIADRIRKYVSINNFTTVGHVTCSIGVAEYHHGEMLSDFIKRADDALYLAKDNGRDRVEVGRIE
ncbi:MAG: diguanylate cyclase [Deferribacteraceae bacterium]|jgi:diguanylate cyclase (GGDEF)-like protein|nr:diguanylate cyclase [Deferribacteraceae bacterium]